ncbi:E3 ubiquitin-protein ligase Topors [Bombyx mori]|uniref:E3 ubiquitin-protein ligase Topors n=1 Tax=Bombyx mori TaxID=7091 RepID=A0A8R2LVB0_BOMMO|nr:E3 ubiquitin-protein ligase Topors [Bombyx mori]XP_004930052.1 E3 ubiquitin-protein ligase Topors [Bombyx mori]XP_037867286.1 E3 ubiquitin-protein ligase Topors [Bombyx mori]
MATIPQSLDDISEANPSSIKSDDSSPHHDNSRGSPPPNCAICLGTCKNKSFTDSCLHQFCFNCLVTWSKVKAECPLCKQNFKSIIYNVRANQQYEEYQVEQRQVESSQRIDIDTLTNRRFRYRTTLTLPRRQSIAFQQLLLRHYPLVANVLSPPRRRRSPASFRRTVYRHNLWARPLPDFTGRFRDCTPEFYRSNATQLHRLVPWLNRELSYLLNGNVGHISYVLTRILEMLPHHHITFGTEFREAMTRFFGDRTDHFLHELYCFASTPYDMTGYDRNVQYTTDSRMSTMVNEVISSSESDGSVDSDIVMVSSSSAAEPSAGPSGVPRAPPRAALAANNIIPIETISHSDTDDDSSEVMVVGYIKPPQDRTPELVDLVGSDSDVVIAETTQPQPGPSDTNAGPFVKLTLKRDRPEGSNWSGSDSDDSYRPLRRRRRRPRSSDSATTADTRRTTPEPASSTSASSDADQSSTDTSLSDDRKTGATRKKIRKRSSREGATFRRERNGSGRRSSPGQRRDNKVNTDSSHPDRDRRSKKKSHSGKGVKCSRRLEEPPPEARPTESAGRKLRSVVTVMRGRTAGPDRRSSISDSDDDLPLNLTVQKKQPPS